MENRRPVGVFDSGVGGLAVLRHLRLLLPSEDVLYVADSAWCPYGPRPAATIRERMVVVVSALQAQGVKLVVVACNSATTAGLAAVRRAFPGLDFVGTEPAVKPAAVQTRTMSIGVLATAATATGGALSRLTARYGGGVAVHVAVPDGLVELVEQGDGDSAAAEALLRPILRAWRRAGVDVVVLGCTHFPFARRAVERAAGPGIAVVDPTPAVARQAARILAAAAALAPAGPPGRTTFLTSGDPARLFSTVRALARTGAVPAAWGAGRSGSVDCRYGTLSESRVASDGAVAAAEGDRPGPVGPSRRTDVETSTL
jgi:glutamate racemase